MQLKKDIEEERLIMTNISVTKNVLTATHTKYRVTKDFSTCVPLIRIKINLGLTSIILREPRLNVKATKSKAN
jgi:hypothetical protein